LCKGPLRQGKKEGDLIFRKKKEWGLEVSRLTVRGGDTKKGRAGVPNSRKGLEKQKRVFQLVSETKTKWGANWGHKRGEGKNGNKNGGGAYEYSFM